MNGIDDNQSSGNLPESLNPQPAIIGENIIASPAQETITYSSSDNNPPLKRNWLKILLIVLLVIFFIAGGVFGYLFFNNTRKSLPSVTAEPSPAILPLPTSVLVPTASPTPPEVQPSVAPTPRPTKKPTPTAIKVPTPTSTPVPTATPTPNPTVTSSTSSGARCQIVANPGFGPAPLTVSLTYSASNLGESYVTGIQWDYNGDGNWDSDMSLNNGSVTYTYSTVGVFNPRMRLQLSNGQTTDPCSTSIGVQPH